MKKPKITVVGSLNMDMVLHCDQLPKAGQTVLAKQTQQVSGGKGANQAVAAAKAGGNVKMLGCVGDDVFGGQLIDNLNSHEIESSNVRAVRDCASGIAIVTVDELGELNRCFLGSESTVRTSRILQSALTALRILTFY